MTISCLNIRAFAAFLQDTDLVIFAGIWTHSSRIAPERATIGHLMQAMAALQRDSVSYGSIVLQKSKIEHP